jgi:RNA polymerase sigma-70 factor (ECF subfamily)
VRVVEDLVRRARARDENAFRELVEPYRRELQLHCYRMLGSVQDAEDLLQETLLAAWRGLDRFEGRASLRAWLYRIATNRCLNALRDRKRRPQEVSSMVEPPQPTRMAEPMWLEPYPDALLEGIADPAAEPAARYEIRESVGLAFVAALQHLPPRQRAVLIMREVLGWRAAEVAEQLGTTTVAVNSMLQRARAQISELAPSEDEVSEPASAQQRELLDRYVAAFQDYDTAALATLFSADAVWEMPPFTGWYQTPEHIVRLTKTHCPASGPGDMVLLPAAANGQPAFGLYMRGDDGVHRAFQLHVVHLRGPVIDHVVAFFDTSLFGKFGLPDVLPAAS